MTGRSRRDPDAAGARRIALGVLAGGGALLGMALLLAVMAIGLGWIRPAASGRVNLVPWLVLEIIGGAAASVLAGWVCRRVARRFQGPAILAAAVFGIGLIEASAILGSGAAIVADAPAWLVLLAPVVAAAGVLLGGWRPAPRTWLAPASRPMVRMSAATRVALPVVALVALTALSLFGLPERGSGRGSQVVATALAIDFTVTVPALVYALLVRARRLPWIAIVPTFVVGYALALATLSVHEPAVLDWMRFAVVPAELTVIGYLVLHTRRALRRAPRGDGDFATRLRALAYGVVGSRIPADILTTEIAILYYAFGPRRTTRASGAFTVHREVGYSSILVALLVLLVVETIALHVFVSRWGATASWMLTGLSLYAVIWLVGDYRAMTARPTCLTPTRLSMRVGVRWEAEILRDQIAAIEPMRSEFGRPGRDTLLAALLGQPNLRLMLTTPVEVIGMYGIRRTVREIWMRVDEAPALCEALRDSGPSRGATQG